MPISLFSVCLIKNKFSVANVFTNSAKLQPDYLLYYKIHIGILLVVTHEWFDFISFTVKPHGCVFLKSLCLFLSELNCNISISSRTFGLKYDLEG